MLDRHRHLSTGFRWALALFVWVAVQVFTPVPDLCGIDCRRDFVLNASSVLDGSGLDRSEATVYLPSFSQVKRGVECSFGLLTSTVQNLGQQALVRQGVEWSRGMLVSAGLMDDSLERSFRVVSVRSSRNDRLLPWPVRGSISSSYGMRRHPVLRRRSFHGAIDIRARVGTPVTSPVDGVVKTVCRAGAMGRMIRVQCGETIMTFAHLSAYRVSVGQRIYRGQTLGLVGASGRATGPHLHFAVSIRGRTVNPLTFLGRR